MKIAAVWRTSSLCEAIFVDAPFQVVTISRGNIKGAQDTEVCMRIVHHTWQWLASRLPVQTIWNNRHAAPSRPCLPTAELLGDSVMLDATAAVEIGDIKGEADAQILIGMIKGELEISKLQL